MPTDPKQSQPSDEANLADALEQDASLDAEEDWAQPGALDIDRDVSEADAVEQLREVELDDEDYR